MAAEPQTFPAVYRAIVAAGLRCGRLAPLLEGLANSARKLREVRHVMLMSLLYPLGVLLLVFGLFSILVLKVLPTFPDLYDRHPPAALRNLLSIGDHLGVWGPVGADCDRTDLCPVVVSIEPSPGFAGERRAVSVDDARRRIAIGQCASGVAGRCVGLAH